MVVLVFSLFTLSTSTRSRANNIGKGIIDHTKQIPITRTLVGVARKSRLIRSLSSSRGKSFLIRNLTGKPCILAIGAMNFMPGRIGIVIRNCIGSLVFISLVPRTTFARDISSSGFTSFSVSSSKCRSIPTVLSSSTSIFSGVTKCGFDGVHFHRENCSSDARRICLSNIELGSTLANCAPCSL